MSQSLDDPISQLHRHAVTRFQNFLGFRDRCAVVDNGLAGANHTLRVRMLVDVTPIDHACGSLLNQGIGSFQNLLIGNS